MTYDFIGVFLFVFAVATMLLGAWGLWWNEKTSQQRQELIELISKSHVAELADGSYSGTKWELYTDVTYHEHHMSLMMLRDPILLYDPAIQELWRKR